MPAHAQVVDGGLSGGVAKEMDGHDHDHDPDPDDSDVKGEALCAAKLAKKSAASGLSDRLGALPVFSTLSSDVHAFGARRKSMLEQHRRA